MLDLSHLIVGADVMAESPYIPIACADYDIYEIAIMQGRPLLLNWSNQSGDMRHVTVQPLSLNIKHKAEYLLVDVPDEGIEDIRLDKILQATLIESDK